MSGLFNGEKFRAWWNGLTPADQQPYKDKAAWERMSLAAVVYEWWPEVWAEIGCEVEEEGTTT